MENTQESDNGSRIANATSNTQESNNGSQTAVETSYQSELLKQTFTNAVAARRHYLTCKTERETALRPGDGDPMWNTAVLPAVDKMFKAEDALKEAYEEADEFGPNKSAFGKSAVYKSYLDQSSKLAFGRPRRKARPQH